MKTYTGIGSRETPETVQSFMADLWDMRERNPDEYEYLRNEVKREKEGE